MLTSETLKKIRRAQLKMDRLATDQFLGLYKSAFKGRGIEIEEVREYGSGDDPRDIDWKVTARMHKPFVKVFKEERQLTVMLVVDISSSTQFGTTQLKSEIIAEIGGILAFSAIKNQDKIGLLLFANDIVKYVPPKRGLRHVFRIIRELYVSKPALQKTNITKALKFLGKMLPQKAVCILFSDFICEDFGKAFAPLAKKHDMLAIRVYDPDEIQFPNMGLVQFQDLETGTLSTIDTSSKVVQSHFSTLAQQRVERHAAMVKRSHGSWIDIGTHQDYITEIRKYLLSKQGRRQ